MLTLYSFGSNATLSLCFHLPNMFWLTWVLLVSNISTHKYTTIVTNWNYVQSKTHIQTNYSSSLNTCILLQGVYRLWIRVLERKRQRLQQHKCPGASCGKSYSKHSAWNAAHCLSFCCNLLLYTATAKKPEWFMFPLWPLTLFLAGNLARVATSCQTPCAFSSHLSCPPLISLVLSIPRCPPAVFAQLQRVSLCWAVWCTARQASQWDSDPAVAQGQVGSGWAWLPSPILAGGKTSCCRLSTWGCASLQPW